ncbi:hypothetical protein RJ639_025529 [Escallonia herrerae]|uniref:Gag protein n=1 Tax=Escallonia herrerae TaxID=1293975 RepID=A0AA88S6V9_9ASTE|nr:hypothetical protein RJ639_025529 [Escallonia herrerae]
MATSETNPESGLVNPNVQHSGGTVYATPYVAPAHGSVGLGERPEKFNEKDFKRWQQKMLFYLTTLNLARFLQEDAPDLGENPDRQTVAAVDAWKHLDFLCKNYILNGLDNALYNVYSPMVNAKVLWESLERKYKTEDAGSKKFVVGKFLDFKMVDSKTVISQVQEFQLILHDIHAEGMHKRKEMKLEDLIVRLRIEEDNRQYEKKVGNYHQEAKANVVEQESLQPRPEWSTMIFNELGNKSMTSLNTSQLQLHCQQKLFWDPYLSRPHFDLETLLTSDDGLRPPLSHQLPFLPRDPGFIKKKGSSARSAKEVLETRSYQHAQNFKNVNFNQIYLSKSSQTASISSCLFCIMQYNVTTKLINTTVKTKSQNHIV